MFYAVQFLKLINFILPIGNNTIIMFILFTVQINYYYVYTL